MNYESGMIDDWRLPLGRLWLLLSNHPASLRNLKNERQGSQMPTTRRSHSAALYTDEGGTTHMIVVSCAKKRELEKEAASLS